MAIETQEHITSETKQTIFATAARLFAEKGFNGVSMREISEQSDVSKPTIYYYFGSKEGIFRELVDASISDMYDAIDKIADLHIPVKEKLVLMTKKFFSETQKNRDFIKFFLNMSISTPEASIIEQCRIQAHKRGRVLAKMIQEGVDSGEFGASAKPELAASIIGGAIQHFIWQQLATEEIMLSNALAEDIIEILFKGLNE